MMINMYLNKYLQSSGCRYFFMAIIKGISIKIRLYDNNIIMYSNISNGNVIKYISIKRFDIDGLLYVLK